MLLNCSVGEDSRGPWTLKRSNQSILKEINPEYSLEGLMLKLKLQHCGHLMWRADSLQKTLMLRKIESRRRRGWQRTRWLDGITNPMDMTEQALGDGEGQGSLVCCSPWGCIELYSTEQLNKVDIYKPTDPRCQKQFNWWVRNHIWNQILHWHVSKK